MPAMDTAIYWIEYVAKYGGRHLQTSSVYLPWYRYMMLDVFAFLAISIAVYALVAYKFLKWALQLFIKKSKRD